MSKCSETQSTRERLVQEATHQFASKGFYGASISGIANELGVTKQTLLHHFGTKEKLYAEVLQLIALRFQEQLAALNYGIRDPLERLHALMLDQATGTDKAITRIVVRELMDNRNRADQAGQWYLREWLDALVDLVLEIPSAATWDRARALAFIYQILGAISYMEISEPTLRNMFGARKYRAMASVFPDQLSYMIRSQLSDPDD